MEQDKGLAASFDLLTPLLVHLQAGHYVAVSAEDVADVVAEDYGVLFVMEVAVSAEDVADVVAEDSGVLFAMEVAVSAEDVADVVAEDSGVLFAMQVTNNQDA